METMSSKRRFLSSLFGGRTDRPSVGNPTSIVTVELQQQAGVFFPEVHLDGEKMATLAGAAQEIFGFDTVAPYFSVQQEAAALGCEVDWGAPDIMPGEKTHPFARPEDVCVPSDFLEMPSTRAVLDAIGILKKRYKGQVAIVGKVMGPWTLAYHTHGLQDFLLEIMLDPDTVRQFVDRLRQVTLIFGRAQLEAGADVVCLADHATGDLVGAWVYRDFLMQAHEEIIRELGCPVILHICGNTADRLEYILQAGFDCFHFDSKVDAKKARQIVGDKMSLVGNVNNPQTLLHGTPEDVRREVFYALDSGIEIIAPECALPLPTPNRNVRAIREAVDEYSRHSEENRRGR